jgi:CSLREA domain-containing protein
MLKRFGFLNDFHKKLTLWIIFCGILSISIFIIVQPAYAVTITVNTTEDELNEDGDCSLREAIQAANTDSAIDACLAGSGEDTINLPAGEYILEIVGAQEDDNQTGDLDIIDDLIIIGEGDDNTIIDANHIDRVFQIFSGVNLEIYEVEITGGKTRDDDIEHGGGIYNEGNLSLFSCTISNNRAGDMGGSGGGIWNNGTLVIDRCSIDSNSCGFSHLGHERNGGGIYNSGEAEITHSTISNNFAGTGEDRNGFGGGIMNTGFIALTMSTISGNAIGYTDCMPESLESSHPKKGISLNYPDNNNPEQESNPGDGGGIWNSGTINISFCTIAMNQTGCCCGGRGGGIYNEGTLNIDSSLLNMNTNVNSLEGADCYGDLNITGANYIKETEGCNLSDIVMCCGEESGMYSLADNGGETLTHGIASFPFADQIGEGSYGCGTDFTNDQRDFPRLVGSGCDLGSLELQEGEIPNVIELVEFKMDGDSEKPKLIITSSFVIILIISSIILIRMNKKSKIA